MSHCVEKHSTGCGCLSDRFIAKAHTNFTSILVEAQSQEEFVGRLMCVNGSLVEGPACLTRTVASVTLNRMFSQGFPLFSVRIMYRGGSVLYF